MMLLLEKNLQDSGHKISWKEK